MKKVIVGIGWFISLICLYFFFAKVDWTKMSEGFAQANYWYFIPVVAVYLSGYVTRSFRWYFLLKTIKKVSFPRLFSVLVIGFMANNVLPMRMGEVVRAYLFGKRENISKSASFATILVERLFDGLTIVFFFILSFTMFSAMQAGGAQSPVFQGKWGMSTDIFAKLIALGFLCLLGFCGVLLYLRAASLRYAERILVFLPHRFKKVVLQFFHRFIDGLAVLVNPIDLGAVVLLSLLSWSLEATTYFLTALAFNIHLTLIMTLLLMSVVNLAVLIPSTPGGLGVFESSGLVILLLFSVQKELARSYILALHAVIYLPIVILGFYYLWKNHLSLKEVQG